MKKLILLAYGFTARAALESLKDKFDVICIITPPSENDSYELPVEKLANEIGIDILRTNSNSDLKGAIEGHSVDAVVISAYNKIIPESILQLSKFINVHHGDLPRWKGRANINWAIILGRNSIGLTMHEAIPALDSGNIYKQIIIPIEESDNVQTVYEKFNFEIRNHLAAVVEQVLNGYEGDEQVGNTTYCCTRLPEDGLIDWTKSAKEIHNLVRGITAPYDGAFTYLDGHKMVIWESELPSNPKIYEASIPGRVCAVHKGEGVEVLTGNSSIIIKQVNYKGDNRNATEFIKSVKKTMGHSKDYVYATLNAQIETLEKRIAELEQKS